MKLPSDPNKFTAKWRYTELACWRPDQDGVWKVMREVTGKAKNKKPVLMDWEDVERYRKKHNNVGIYTSVWNYNSTDFDRASRLGPLYFDLDSIEVERSYQEAIRLADYLANVVPDFGLRVYFTGKKGFHIECEPVTLGINASNELPGLFRFIANELKTKLSLNTIDFAVYDTRRMWRLPNSQHQGTRLYKVHLGRERLQKFSLEDIFEYARQPHFEEEIPEQAFDYKANEWFREWGYKEQEERTLSVQDRINRFNKLGTSTMRKVGDGELTFDPKSLLENCHAINDLWKKAETTHDLNHEERLFLCSILTYTDESQTYLHAILQNCDDYNESKSQAHIDDWIRRRELGIGGRPYSCQRANSAGVGCGDCHLEPRDKVIKVGDKWVKTGEEAQPSALRFAYYRKKS